MFALAEEGYRSVFQQLVACVLSIRTRDEVSIECARSLFRNAPDARAISRLSEARIDGLIHASTFHQAKAGQIREIARRAVAEFGGELPCDALVLRSFRGVGPKCAHLAMGVACGTALISVDVHVHRVTNRWGYVREPTPEATMAALQEKLPRRFWIEINALLVPFGKHICTGTLPKCSTCPVLRWCRQAGVRAYR
jgi:endonuclease-3